MSSSSPAHSVSRKFRIPSLVPPTAHHIMDDLIFGVRSRDDQSQEQHRRSNPDFGASILGSDPGREDVEMNDQAEANEDDCDEHTKPRDENEDAKANSDHNDGDRDEDMEDLNNETPNKIGNESGHHDEKHDENHDEASDEHSGQDEDDLFASTFGRKSDKRTQASESPSPSPSPPPSKRPKTHHKPPFKSLSTLSNTSSSQKDDGHTAPCKPSHRPSTPPLPRPNPISSRKAVKQTLSPLLLKQSQFHALCLPLIPTLPLAAPRFWIGILHITKRSPKSEKDLVWMKANAKTTLRTLIHAYAAVAARGEGEVELWLEGYGACRLWEKVGELELFRDRKVFFRAVERGKGGFGGAWEVSRGLVTDCKEVPEQVVVLD